MNITNKNYGRRWGRIVGLQKANNAKKDDSIHVWISVHFFSDSFIDTSIGAGDNFKTRQFPVTPKGLADAYSWLAAETKSRGVK